MVWLQVCSKKLNPNLSFNLVATAISDVRASLLAALATAFGALERVQLPPIVKLPFTTPPDTQYLGQYALYCKTILQLFQPNSTNRVGRSSRENDRSGAFVEWKR